MGKVIQFPKKIIQNTYTYKDYLETLNKIKDLAFDIELSEGYNEYWKDDKTEEEYNYCLQDINNMKTNLDELKLKLEEIRSVI